MHGSQMGVISTEALTVPALVERARGARGMEGLDLATGISTKKVYAFTDPTPNVFGEPRAKPELKHHVVAYDYGLKKAMIQLLVDAGCRVTVVPSNHSAEAVL